MDFEDVVLQVIRELNDGESARVSQEQGERLAQALDERWDHVREGTQALTMFCVPAGMLLAHLSNVAATCKAVKALSKKSHKMLNVREQTVKNLFLAAVEAEKFIERNPPSPHPDLHSAWLEIKPKLEQEVKRRTGLWTLNGGCSMS